MVLMCSDLFHLLLCGGWGEWMAIVRVKILMWHLHILYNNDLFKQLEFIKPLVESNWKHENDINDVEI